MTQIPIGKGSLAFDHDQSSPTWINSPSFISFTEKSLNILQIPLIYSLPTHVFLLLSVKKCSRTLIDPSTAETPRDGRYIPCTWHRSDEPDRWQEISFPNFLQRQQKEVYITLDIQSYLLRFGVLGMFLGSNYLTC